VTPQQQQLYREFAKTGQVLTWDSMASIERQALQQAGMNPIVAANVVDRAHAQLQRIGIEGPARIPWGG